MVRIFGFEFRKVKPQTGHVLTDDDRIEGLSIRRQRAEIRQVEHDIRMAEARARLAEAKADFRAAREESDDDEVDEIFGEFIRSILSRGKRETSTTGDVTPPVTLSLTDAAIEDHISRIPESVKVAARSMSDNELEEYLEEHTNFDDDTIDRSIKIFRAKNS